MDRPQQTNTGFSLIELLVVVTIVGILAAVAMPAYNDYVTRSRFTEAASLLADYRVKLEQFYQDNRNYGSTAAVCGVANPAGTAFAFNCNWGAVGTNQGYTATATGNAAQGLAGISFTIDQSNTRTTTVAGGSVMAGNGYTAAVTACWVRKKPALC